MALTQDSVLNALKTVHDPELFKDIVTLGMVKNIKIDGPSVAVTVELTTPNCPLKDTIRRDVEKAVRSAGATTVTVDLTARGAESAPSAPPSILPQVKNVIAVGAGKGGVGKSTIAVNLAIGLARRGHAVGLMDGDIYGPSMPTMLGLKGQTPQLRGNKLTPISVHGIHAITIGCLVDQDKPLIWRGPMAHGAFKQLFSDNTDWPALDYLIVDLPPGTGDVPLTLCQLLPLTGAVVVATPQQVALDDALRAVKMFEQLGTPVLGLVENMSYFIGPDGTEHDIFGRGGAESAAQAMNIPYLGHLPMVTSLRVNSDAGNPHANFDGDEKLKASLESLVTNLLNQITLRKAQPPTPTLNIL